MCIEVSKSDHFFSYFFSRCSPISGDIYRVQELSANHLEFCTCFIIWKGSQSPSSQSTAAIMDTCSDVDTHCSSDLNFDPSSTRQYSARPRLSGESRCYSLDLMMTGEEYYKEHISQNDAVEACKTSDVNFYSARTYRGSRLVTAASHSRTSIIF
ncbi:hypothetical protein SISSUDRAFT_915862 [Sistotremastrum suecicum HHB10207 ss-3]|uniref:Uncharacterized protein n=1 Tax=Sistotremastrum suecicum HHB10207 ss-3 TaxID=1314776 RepID=A0A166BZT0_9AGAM|nr:hypothetical protein SISSUDRAFT_915862 [Sistotremastrum suecicum HHB10207 ss-3]